MLTNIIGGRNMRMNPTQEIIVKSKFDVGKFFLHRFSEKGRVYASIAHRAALADCFKRDMEACEKVESLQKEYLLGLAPEGLRIFLDKSKPLEELFQLGHFEAMTIYSATYGEYGFQSAEDALEKFAQLAKVWKDEIHLEITYQEQYGAIKVRMRAAS